MSIYSINCTRNTGEVESLEKYKGKVLLIVNTATGCGFTPQYDALESIYEKFNDKGFEVLDFPCNQFKEQAPEDDNAIHTFCTMNFNTKFPRFKKADVNGENAQDLFKYLCANTKFEGFGNHERAELLEQLNEAMDPDFRNNGNIKWNFTKFLIGKDGEILQRFEPTADMAEVEKAVEKALS